MEGSPLIAVKTQPPFKEYFFIDLDGKKVENLRHIFGQRPDIHIYPGDCNDIMLQNVLPNVRWQGYRRGLCLLDPYGLHLNWEVIHEVGQMRSIDLFLNFPVADMNRNVFWHNPEGVAEADIARMNTFWGDESWRNVVYQEVKTMYEPDVFQAPAKKTANQTIADAFRQRLQEVAGFNSVPEPLPMCNTKGAIVYYLFFASPKPVAQDIVEYIFKEYRNRGAQ